MLVQFSWDNPRCTMPLITTAANAGIIEIENSYLTTKLLKAMGCAL